jgi:AraC-like DNA-binding protein
LRQAKEPATGIFTIPLGTIPATVATAVGFADQCHFNRRFKRLAGETPGQFSLGDGLEQEHPKGPQTRSILMLNKNRSLA